jgi:hypothetical protein
MAGAEQAAVASFTGAWMETVRYPWSTRCCSVASFTGAWIETGGRGHAVSVGNVASFTGGVITLTQQSPSPTSGLAPADLGAGAPELSWTANAVFSPFAMPDWPPVQSVVGQLIWANGELLTAIEPEKGKKRER